MFKKTKVKEPASCETLHMELAYRNDDEDKRMIDIGVLEKDSIGDEGTICLQIVQFKSVTLGWGCTVATADLTREEIDLVIKGLQEAKDRMGKPSI